MNTRKPRDTRQEPQFGYDDDQRREPYFEDRRAAPPYRSPRSRRQKRAFLPVFLVGAVLILFMGFIWVSYKKGPKLVGQLPVITADSSPVKVKPDKPGGADIPFQDTTVYDDLTEGKQKHPAPEVEHLLQPPEQPLPMPQAAGEAVAPPAPEGAKAPEAPAPPPEPAIVAKADEPPPAPAQPDTNEAALAPPEPAPTAQAANLLPPPPAPAPVTPAAIKPPAKAPSKPQAALPLKAKPKPVAAAAGTAVIQLGSFQDETAAKSEWLRLKSRYSDQLSSLSPIVQRVDLGEKGIWYRLRAGPLSADKAKSACAALTEANAPCIVPKHG